MAFQESTIQLIGKLGNLSFYKTQDGYLVRKKSGVSGERLKTEPAFVRARENMAEFGRAGLAAKDLRNALRIVILNSSDNRANGRLTRAMKNVLNADTVNSRGQRDVITGDMQILRNFDFNVNTRFAETFMASYIVSIDRPGGKIDIDIPAFEPKYTIVFPDAATHCVLKAAATLIDFNNSKFVTGFSESVAISRQAQMLPPIHLTQSVTPASVHAIIAVLGIEFFQEVNGIQYPLKNSAYNAMAIVAIDQ